MAEANARLQQTPTEAQAQTMNGAVVVLAWRSAKEAVKLSLRAQRLKLQQFSAREIAVLAEDYLADHRAQLIHQAREIVDHWNAQGRFGPRGGFRRRRN
jgi:hypothetical protein